MSSSAEDISNDGVSADREPLSQDLVFDLLSSSRRRFVLYYLRTEEGPVKLTTLADEVAAWEYETSIEELTEKEQKRAYVSLYQTHVPKLDEAGVVAYDADSGMLRATDRARALDEYLPSGGGSPISWEIIYLALSLIGVVLFAIGLSDGVFGVVSVTVAGASILLLFTATALIHFISARRREHRLPIELADKNKKRQ